MSGWHLYTVSAFFLWSLKVFNYIAKCIISVWHWAWPAWMLLFKYIHNLILFIYWINKIWLVCVTVNRELLFTNCLCFKTVFVTKVWLYQLWKIASQSRKTKRKQPYDLNNPANWTAAQLRAELEKLRYKLTLTSIPKSALKQIYEQVISHEKSVVGDQRHNNVGLDAREQLEINESSATENSKTLSIELETLSFRTQDNHVLSDSSSVMPDSAEPVSAVTASTVVTMTNSSVDNASSSTTCVHMSNELIQNTLGMVSTMQSTISSLQSTINTCWSNQLQGRRNQTRQTIFTGIKQYNP